MTFIMMTRVQSLMAFFLLLAFALVSVQGQLDPEDIGNRRPLFPDRHPLFPNPPTVERTHFELQPTNLDESQFWASSKNTGDAGGSKQPRGGVTTAYNYALEDTEFDESQFRAPVKTTGGKSKERRPGDETEILWISGPRFATPEELAQFRAMQETTEGASESKTRPGAQRNEIQHTKFDESQFQAPVKTTGSQFKPEILEDGTEILWVSEPKFTTAEELARFGGMMHEKTTQGAGESKALPGAQRNEVHRTDVQPTEFDESTESWEAGPWGTKHRPGAKTSLLYVGFDDAAQAGRSKELPLSHNP